MNIVHFYPALFTIVKSVYLDNSQNLFTFVT